MRQKTLHGKDAVWLSLLALLVICIPALVVGPILVMVLALKWRCPLVINRFLPQLPES